MFSPNKLMRKIRKNNIKERRREKKVEKETERQRQTLQSVTRVRPEFENHEFVR